MTKMENIHLQVTKELITEIETFQKEHFFSSRADVIRYLISLGLKHHDITEELLTKKPNQVKKFLNDN